MLRLRDVAESCERLRKVAVVTSRNLPKHSLTFRNIGNHGVILLSVLIILLTISLIGASLMSFFFSVDVTAQYSVESAKAFYLAEAGIAHAVVEGGAVGQRHRCIHTHLQRAGRVGSMTGETPNTRKMLDVKRFPSHIGDKSLVGMAFFA